jgi:hypothetical protein
VNRAQAGLGAALVLWAITVQPLAAVDYGTRLGETSAMGGVSFEPQGPGVLFESLDPAVRRWFVPQELFKEYRWSPWEVSNYARENYQRYVNTSLEGDNFYDVYGSSIGRGWLIFNSSQEQPKQFGSSIFKSNRFSDWFSGLIISSDERGQYHYSVTIGNEIRSTLTPMTFSKPRWDGVQIDVASDRFEGTMIMSRLSRPGGSSTNEQESLVSNLTTLLGGRLTAQVGDFAKIGLTAVNAHQSNTLVDGFRGNPIHGELTIDQQATITAIEILLRDDSPEDGVGGAAFFPAGSDIVIRYVDGTEDRGKNIRFGPVIEGGFIREGFIAADGTEQIRLRYDFNSPDFLNRASASKEEIEQVEFQLVLANDYQVWVTSDRQLNSAGTSVPILVAQAKDNVQDNTNLTTLRFDYGLPTATQIWGATLELTDVLGMRFYGEYDISSSYRKYPNPIRKTHSTSSGIRGAESAPAWMMNLSKRSYPYFASGEAYSMDPQYNTSTYVVEGSGFIDYEDPRVSVIDLVADNDDQDRFADNIRRDTRNGDAAVFPGWDENNDFISDYNQNDNRVLTNSVPDYEEAFLRHNVDRPEFLFGLDMNNNLWTDRFENDDLPDYPYRKDHEGFNVYGGAYLRPQVRLVVGMLREHLISSDLRNHANYAVFSFDEDTPNLGRLRIFNGLKSVKDNIPNDLVQWLPGNALRTGEGTRYQDPLLARDTWSNSFWIAHDYGWAGLSTRNSIKYDLYEQRLGKTERTLYSLRARDYFFGVINKAKYRWDLEVVWIEPRWKSEFRKQTFDLFSTDKRTELTEIGGLLLGMPLLQHTVIQSGVELTFHNDLDRNSNDFRGVAWAFQASNRSAFQGYQVTLLGGLKIDHKNFKNQEAETLTQAFMTMYAGL